MFSVSREIDFCYGHRLLNYGGKCRFLHGHNGRAVITIEAESLDHRGMVLDFSDIKDGVTSWIDDNLDHRMLLCRDDPFVPAVSLPHVGEVGPHVTLWQPRHGGHVGFPDGTRPPGHVLRMPTEVGGWLMQAAGLQPRSG